MDSDSNDDNFIDQQYDIELLVRAKTYLDSFPVRLQSPDYKKIVDMVNEYIHRNCKHRIVDDSIDVSLDESRSIRYCELCFKNF
jgi:hypothetical protein